jgi:hypothetical protein
MKAMTVTMIDAALDEAVETRQDASEAEVAHYAALLAAGEVVEMAGRTIDTLLAERAALAHAEDPIDPTDPATVAAIEGAWADFEPAEADPSYLRFLNWWVSSYVTGTPIPSATRLPVEALPAFVRDEHGCYVSDLDDPQWTSLPSSRVECHRQAEGVW